ncbi:MAG: adenosine deaminase [Anaerolineaceae bacterium]|nr:adenosine deaminase [Anaerolineaceae bacterium]
MKELLSNYPKIELHSHLDCTLSLKAIERIIPGITQESYLNTFTAPSKCTDLVHYLKFTQNCVALLQNQETLRLAVEDLFEQMQAENVLYSEIRFAPFLHTEEGLSGYDVIKTVEAACADEIARTGIEARIILCTLCHYTPEMSMQVMKLAEKFKASLVAGVDISGDEAGFPVEIHSEAFQYAKKIGVPRTAHAGEAVGAENVWLTLREYQPTRIGHGIHSISDPDLMNHLRETQIHLEICPICNVQTDSIATIEEHPVDKLYRAGINLGISTDTRGITQTSLVKEYQTLMDVFNWDQSHFLKTNLNALETAFIPSEIKTSLREQLISGYDL